MFSCYRTVMRSLFLWRRDWSNRGPKMIHGRDYLILSIWSETGGEADADPIVDQSILIKYWWVLGSCLSLPTEYVLYISPRGHHCQISLYCWLMFSKSCLHCGSFHEVNTCTQTPTCSLPPLRRFSLPTFRPHLQAKVFHINFPAYTSIHVHDYPGRYRGIKS